MKKKINKIKFWLLWWILDMVIKFSTVVNIYHSNHFFQFDDMKPNPWPDQLFFKSLAVLGHFDAFPDGWVVGGLVEGKSWIKIKSA